MTAGWLRTSRAGCSGASVLVGFLSAAFPLRDGARHPEWAAMRWLGSACRDLILCVAADRCLDRGDSTRSASGSTWTARTRTACRCGRAWAAGCCRITRRTLIRRRPTGSRRRGGGSRIYITHGHGDHWLGLARLIQRFPEPSAWPRPRSSPRRLTRHGRVLGSALPWRDSRGRRKGADASRAGCPARGSGGLW